MDKCREEFEKAFRESDAYNWYSLSNTDERIFSQHEGSYESETVRSHYQIWQHQQAKVEEQAQEIANLKSLIQGHELRHQQNLSIKQKLTRRLEELEEEFAEDERFLKEQIKDKDLKISNLKYQQGMDKELIKALQSKSAKLQKQVTDLDNRATQYALDEMATAKLNGELQKRVEAALERANQACISNEMFHKQFDDVIRILRGEQALKGEG